MLTTDHHDEAHDDIHDGDVLLRRVTASEIPALLDAFRTAAYAARVATDALLAHGIGPDRVTVEANLTDDGQPLVCITAMTTGTNRANTGGGGGGPPRSANGPSQALTNR